MPDYKKTTNKNLQPKMSLSETSSAAQASLKSMSSLQKAVLFTDEQQQKILEEIIKNNPGQNDTKEQFQIVFKNNHGQSDYQFAELKQTPTGKLAIELEEQTIKIIEEKSLTDPYLYMSIKKSSTGRVLVDFDTKENTIDNDVTHRVKVRQTSSGTKLDIHKNMIRILKDTLPNKIPNESLCKSIELPPNPSRPEGIIDADAKLFNSASNSPLKDITLPRTTGHHLEQVSGSILTEIYMRHKKKKEVKWKKEFEQGNADVVVELQVKNGVVQKLSAVVTKTNSDTVVIYAKDVSSLKEISFDGKECPVLISKMVSGTYFVRIVSNHQNFNAVLMKTPSEGVLIISQEKLQNEYENVDYYKVKLSVMRNKLLELPAVLKRTTSENYLVVLDKEFETWYKETLREYFGDNLEGSIDLHTTSSGNYILDLGDEEESNVVKKHAMLVKTSSGHIKVLVHGSEYEYLVQRKLIISSTSAQVLAQKESNLPTSSGEIHKENLRQPKILDNHASSKTDLSGKVEGLRDSLPLVSKPSTVFKKTPSGQYAILLNEESKKSLLNNLQSNSFMSNKEVPIKRLDSGEIIINLSNEDGGKSHYGTLKVTPSGNCHVIVDEKVMKDLTESSKKNEVSCRAIGKRSEHAARLIDSVHTAVATISQAKADDCCCGTSTCVCTDQLFDTRDGSNDKLCTCVWKKASTSGVPVQSTSRDDPDRIVFDPNCNPNPRKNEFESSQQLFYFLGTSHLYHELRFNSSSTKLIGKPETSQLHECQPQKKIKQKPNSEEPTTQNEAQEWNSLDYLPPQLPNFLKDVTFR